MRTMRRADDEVDKLEDAGSDDGASGMAIVSLCKRPQAANAPQVAQENPSNPKIVTLEARVGRSHWVADHEAPNCMRYVCVTVSGF